MLVHVAARQTTCATETYMFIVYVLILGWPCTCSVHSFMSCYGMLCFAAPHSKMHRLPYHSFIHYACEEQVI